MAFGQCGKQGFHKKALPKKSLSFKGMGCNKMLCYPLRLKACGKASSTVKIRVEMLVFIV